MQHGKLTVVKQIEGTRRYLARCECGNTKEIVMSSWGRYFSCGCARAKHHRKTIKNGKGTPLNNRWANIKQRIFNKDCKAYPNYGGRGLTMQPEWAASVDVFAAAVGEPPGKEWELDRIDNDIGYVEGNIRWVKRAANQRNQRRSAKLNVSGVDLPLAWIAKYADVDYHSLYAANRKNSAAKYLTKKGVDLTDLVDSFNAEEWYGDDPIVVGIHRAYA